jgi:anti-sigma factor RsiW
VETDSLTCRELIGFLADYLDGELPEPTRRVFEDHLEDCPPCRDYLASYRTTIALAAEACGPDDRVAEDVPEDLVRAVLAARPTRR